MGKRFSGVLINAAVACFWLLLIGLSYHFFPNQPAVRLSASRIVLIGVAIQLLFVARQERAQIRHRVSVFFTAVTHPINLAVFRIVFFGCLFTAVNPAEIVWFSQLPPELQFAPTGLGWLLTNLPINQTLASISSYLIRLFALTGILGLFSRTSATLTVLLGIYALGIPQFFGKVNHYHHLLWFAAILAASRCGDMFSIDAVWAAWKRADRGVVEPPAESQVYALPLRFVWLLIGIIYFFPGFWKVWLSGFDWALSENFKFQLYNKWSELDGWLPFFRLDQYPLLYKPLALGAIIFELSFIFLIFWPRVRSLMAVGGIIFHAMVGKFMQIHNFWTLQANYVAFFDWHAFFQRLGSWLYPQQLYLVYDGNCQLCRRTIACLRVFDLLGRITYVNALDSQALRRQGLAWLDYDALMVDIHAVVQKQTWAGFAAYRVLAARMPIFWPILPLLSVWPIPKLGNQIYRRVADSRTCQVAHLLASDSRLGKINSPHRTLAITAVGLFLLVINSICGLAGIYRAWPFALYPPFAVLAKETRESLEIIPLSSTGEPLPFDQQILKQKFAADRYEGLIYSILGTGRPDLDQYSSPWMQRLIASIVGSREDVAQQRVRLKALWQVAVQTDPRLAPAASVQFYKVRRWTTPQQSTHPIQRELIFELKL